MADVSQVRYTPGCWVAVAGRRIWLLAEVDSTAPVIQLWWELASSGCSADDLLGAIVHEGFRTVGNFAIVHPDGDTARIIVRGRAGAEVMPESGERMEITGAGVATWLDTSVSEPLVSVRLVTGEPSAGTPSLPVSEGVVLASVLTIGAPTEPAGPILRPEAESEPVLAPRPAPTPEQRPASVPESLPPPAPEPVAIVAEPVEDAPGPEFDHLFGATQHAVPEPEPTAPQPLPPLRVGAHTLPAAAVEEAGIITDLPWAALSTQPGSTQAVPTRSEPTRPGKPTPDIAMTVHRQQPRPSADTPTVLAIRCPAGHLNPEDGRVCRVCGAAVAAQEARSVARPVLGALRLSTGDKIMLDRGVIMGREPQPPNGDDRAWHRVKLPSPGNDISRNHVEVRLEDWQVYVSDLGSTNGTEVTVPDMASSPLQPNEPVSIEPGTVVNLAREISFTFEVTA
jgi:hypothetical protein